jgi:hypothetical protein
LIQIRDLDTHVMTAVPRLSLQLSGLVQEPFDKIAGTFRLAPVGARPRRRCQHLQRDSQADTSSPATARSPCARAEVTADVDLQMEAPTLVQVFKFGPGDWVLIGRADTKLAYVPSAAVQRLKE